MSFPRFVYRINKDDVIVSIETTDGFNGSKDTSAFNPVDYIGKTLWSCFSDETIIHIYQKAISAVRKTGREFILKYRCDAPDFIRKFNLSIRMLENRDIEFINQIDLDAPRNVITLLDPAVPRSSSFITMCSYCLSIRAHDEQWHPLEDAIERFEEFHQSPLPRISHGICPTCLETAMNEIDEFESAAR